MSMAGSEIVRGSAEFRGSADFRDFLVIPEIRVNLGRTMKGYWGEGGTSTTTWLTEMVHLSKFAEFHEEIFPKLCLYDK